MRSLTFLLALAVMAVSVRTAHAVEGCTVESGLSPKAGSELPPHPRVAFWSELATPLRILATLDGKPVPVKTSTIKASPYVFTLIEIDSAATGSLELSVEDGRQKTAATYVVKADVAFAKEANATTSRNHVSMPRSRGRYIVDGVAIAVDVPGLLLHVKIRRDANAQWRELDVPLVDGRTALIGENGCVRNYTAQLLERGVDLDITVMLADGTFIPVPALKHIKLPKLAKPTRRR